MSTRLFLSTIVLASAASITTIALTNRLKQSDAANDSSPEAFSKRVEQELSRQLPAAVTKEVKLQAEEYARKLAVENAIRYAKAEKRARGNSVASKLQTLRSQLELYRIQHNDRFPELAQLKNWSPLLIATDSNGQSGNPHSRNTFGPYVLSASVNPFTSKSTVVAPQNASLEAGWTWEESTGTLRAIVPESEFEDYSELPKDLYIAIK